MPGLKNLVQSIEQSTVFTVSGIKCLNKRRLFEGAAYLNIVPDKFTFLIFKFNGTLSICKFSYGLILN